MSVQLYRQAIKIRCVLAVFLFFIITYCHVHAQDNNHFEISRTVGFPDNQANMVSYIELPIGWKWGWIQVTLTGGFNYQLNKGILSKRITLVDNGANSFSSISSEVITANGELALQWNIGDYDNLTSKIPVYHVASSGNDVNIRVEGQVLSSDGATGMKTYTLINDPISVVNNKSRQYKSIMEERVGIGTLDPKERLSVNGKIRSQEVKVEVANWPDDVFAKGYELPSLQETEKQIKDLGHLPGIPSASEVKANGIDLGDMNARLLKKIEELTLYMIEMKKENEKQKLSIQDLKISNEQLITEVNSIKSKR